MDSVDPPLPLPCTLHPCECIMKISIRHLHKQFSGVTALADVNLEIADGELFSARMSSCVTFALSGRLRKAYFGNDSLGVRKSPTSRTYAIQMVFKATHCTWQFENVAGLR